MNPLFKEALGSILRWLFSGIAGFFVQRGIWTDNDAKTYVAAGALALLALGWSLWQKYGARLKLVTALISPVGTTENQVTQKIASGEPVPPVTSSAAVLPVATAPQPKT